MNTTINLHIYFTDHLVIVPLTRDKLGLWVEVPPIAEVNSYSVEELANKISEYAPAANNLDASNPWDGFQGIVWDSARVFIGARQYEDESWKLTPYKPTTAIPNADTDQIDWTPNSSQSVSIKPSPETIKDVARTLLHMIGRHEIYLDTN
jgi:hypothetical protein